MCSVGISLYSVGSLHYLILCEKWPHTCTMHPSLVSLVYNLALGHYLSVDAVARQFIKQLDNAAASLVAHELFQCRSLGLGIAESTDLELVNGW